MTRGKKSYMKASSIGWHIYTYSIALGETRQAMQVKCVPSTIVTVEKLIKGEYLVGNTTNSEQMVPSAIETTCFGL